MSIVKPINRSRNTQLSDLNYDTSKIIFDEPIIGSIPGTTISFFRINIGTKNANKTEGELVFALPKLSTYGIKESLDQSTKALTGYGAGLILFDREEQTEEHITIAQTINNIVEKCKDHLLNKDIKKKLKKTDLEKSDLKKMSPISLVKDKITEEHQSNKPVLNVKLIHQKAKKDKDGNDVEGKIHTPIYQDDMVDENGEPVLLSSEDYLGKSGMLRAVIKIESIFVGKDIKLQVKIMEAAYKTEQKTNKNRFLSFTNMSSLKKDFEEKCNITFDDVEETEESTPVVVPVQQVDDELNMSEDEEPPKQVEQKKEKKEKKSKK